MLKKIIPIVLLTALILIVPHWVRSEYFDSYMLGDTSYYHARIAEQILDEGIVVSDSLDSSPIEFNAYNYMLAAVGKFTGVPTASNLLPFVLGILAIIFLYLSLNRYQIDRVFTICIFTIISPLFIYTFTVSNPMSVVVLLNLIGLYMLGSKHPWTAVFSFMFIPLFGTLNALVSLVFVIAYGYRFNLRRDIFIIILVLVGSMLFFGSSQSTTVQENLLQDNIVDLGATLGFNIFVLKLEGVGFVKIWKKKRAPGILVILIMLLLVSIYIDSQMKILLNLFIAPLSAIGFLTVLGMHWDQRLVRNLSILILAIALIFTTFNYINRLSYMEPQKEMIDSMIWLQQGSMPGDRVLSHHDNNVFIEYFSLRPTVDTHDNITTLFTTRDEILAEELISNFKIDYIYVDSKTRDLMFTDYKLGLEFLMSNSPQYSLIYEEDDIKIWKFN